MKLLLNQFDNPKLSEQQFVGKGDMVFATNSSEEFHLTPGKEYEIEEVTMDGYLLVKNDKGEVDEYSVEYFKKHRPVLHA